MNSKFCFLILIAGMLNGGLYSQQVSIRYDYLTGNYEFYQLINGKVKPIKKVNISEGTQVSVIVNNLNPFLWKLKAELLESQKTDNNLATGIKSLMSSLKMNPGNLVSGFFGNNPFSNMLGARGNERNTLGFFKESGELFYETADSLKALHEKHQQLLLLENLLENLKITDRISGEVFRSKLLNYIHEYSGWSKYEMDEAVNKGLELDRRKNNLTDSLNQMFDLVHLHYTRLNEATPVFPEAGITAKDYLQSLDSSYVRITQAQRSMEKEQSFSQLHYRIFQLYDVLQKTSFQQEQLLVSPYASDQLKITFRSQLNGDSSLHLIALPNKAKIKVFNTNGLVLPFFKDNRFSYYVDQDSSIKTDGDARVVPYLAAQVNICRQYSEGLKWGYNLGLGLPLTNDKSFVVTTGMCLIFGKNDLFSLAAGVAGSKIKTLARGLKLGDKVNKPLSPLPFKEEVKFAPFMSISFNLAALK